MAMTILNNTASMMTLGELNKNISKVGKDLKKLSTGERLPNFASGASDVAISEKMRVQIRGLSQDERNVQNGQALLRVAEGGMQEIVDNLRTIRELAINAANDHNTDDDRRILQKDIDQRRENINEIASTTSYNGRLLLMGDYATNIKISKQVAEIQYETIKERVGVQVGTTTKQETITTPGVNHYPGVDGAPGVLIQNNHVEGFTKSFTPAYNSCNYVQNPKAYYPAPQGTPCNVGFRGTYSNGYVLPYQNNGTPQDIILKFVKDLKDYTGATGLDRVDHAISVATGGRFTSYSNLQDSFNSDLAASADLASFLKDYCDIDLTNADNGAITGSDAYAGNLTKTAESVINEGYYSDTSAWKMPTPGSTSQTAGGITVSWPTTDKSGNALTDNAKFFMKGLNTVWLDKAWEQIQDTYPGIFDNTNAARNLQITFNDFNTDTNAIAISYKRDASNEITGYEVMFGNGFFKNIDQTNPNGYSPELSKYSDYGTYIDQSIAKIMTDLALSATVKKDDFNAYANNFFEGLEYVVTGYDDTFESTSSLGYDDRKYALMRYMAKQGLKYTDGGAAWSNSTHMAVNAQFNNLTKDGAAATVSDLNGQGFSIACSANCSQFINIKFDTTTNQSSFVREQNNANLSTYTIGIADLTDIADLSKAIFDGISSIDIDERRNGEDSKDVYNNYTNEALSVVIDGQHDLRMMKDPNNSNNYLFLKTYQPTMGFIEGSVIEEPIGGTLDDIPAGTTVIEDTITRDIVVPVFEYHDEDIQVPVGEIKKTVYEDGSNPLYIHTGTKSNIDIAIHINDMRTKAMGFTDDVGVQTRQKASDSLEKIDNAIQYALDEITRVGAYQSRLEFTYENLVTANENTQDAESTIRDADMAKEMTSFTKNNILMQSAQAMMSQANQNASGVLNLLQ